MIFFQLVFICGYRSAPKKDKKKGIKSKTYDHNGLQNYTFLPVVDKSD